MLLSRRERRALRGIGDVLRRSDPLLAAMLTEPEPPSGGGQHPENGKARRRQSSFGAWHPSYGPSASF
jgi:hypothetical protein